MYHRHPPTGWVDWEGPLRPRAFDLNKIDGAQASPWDAPPSCSNANVQAALLARAAARWTRWRATATATSCCSCMRAPAISICDYGHLAIKRRRLRHAAARHHVAHRERGADDRPADRGHQRLLPAARQGAGRPARDLRSRHAGHAEDRRCVPARSRAPAPGRSGSSGATRSRPSPSRTTRWTRWAGRATSRRCASTSRTSGR